MSMEEQGPIDVIPLVGDDGKEYQCQVLHKFKFDDKDYVLLMDLDKAANLEALEEEDATALVVMRVELRNDQIVFNVIENDEEFDRVTSYVDEMVKQAELEESESNS